MKAFICNISLISLSDLRISLLYRIFIDYTIPACYCTACFLAHSVREARKNPDVKTIVSNLQKVKTLKSNDPLLLPDDDFIIQPNTKAIFVRVIKSENDNQ